MSIFTLSTLVTILFMIVFVLLGWLIRLTLMVHSANSAMNEDLADLEAVVLSHTKNWIRLESAHVVDRAQASVEDAEAAVARARASQVAASRLMDEEGDDVVYPTDR